MEWVERRGQGRDNESAERDGQPGLICAGADTEQLRLKLSSRGCGKELGVYIGIWIKRTQALFCRRLLQLRESVPVYQIACRSGLGGLITGCCVQNEGRWRSEAVAETRARAGVVFEFKKTTCGLCVHS